MSQPAVSGPEAEPVADDDGFREAVLRGLAEEQKAIPSKYFYDATGSRLFEAITRLPEYYLTRTELGLLSDAAEEVAGLIGPGAELIEFGAGSLQKVRILLGAMRDARAFIAIDVAREHLVRSAAELAVAFPGLSIRPIVADFVLPLDVQIPGPRNAKRVAFFPGSTIGNFARDGAAAFLAQVAQLVGTGGGFLIGVDLKKDPRILFDAYNDAQSVTAAFNRNLLERINRELGGDFDPSQFDHYAPYDQEHGRVEMHLVSRGPQTVRAAGRAFQIRDGETIHTENSYKYMVEEFTEMAAASGWSTLRIWTDPEELFSVHYLRAD